MINSVKETRQLKSKPVLETGSSQSFQIILISCEDIQHLHLFYQAYSYKNLLTDPARQNTSLPQDCSDLEIAPFTDSPVTCRSGILSLPESQVSEIMTLLYLDLMYFTGSQNHRRWKGLLEILQVTEMPVGKHQANQFFPY